MNKILINLLWIVIIVAIGTFAVNQVLEYNYKSELLQTPCQLCAQTNKEIESCIIQKIRMYPIGNGKWCGEDGYEYVGSEKQKERCEAKEVFSEVNYSQILNFSLSPEA